MIAGSDIAVLLLMIVSVILAVLYTSAYKWGHKKGKIEGHKHCMRKVKKYFAEVSAEVQMNEMMKRENTLTNRGRVEVKLEKPNTEKPAGWGNM